MLTLLVTIKPRLQGKEQGGLHQFCMMICWLGTAFSFQSILKLEEKTVGLFSFQLLLLNSMARNWESTTAMSNPLMALFGIKMAMEVTGLGPRDPRITLAKPLEVVWPDFKSFVENLLQNETQKGVMVTWSAKAHSAEWLSKVTKAACLETVQMSRGVDFFDQCPLI